MIFSIVIPAYNEEQSVSDILRRSLAAAEKIKAAGLGISDVEVILVNDGSSDKTEAIAREFKGAAVLSHHRNRGYGAAIKTGFAGARGDLLGFLDADGTCDPDFFIELISLCLKENLDVAVGSRLHSDARMPAVRVLGNRIFRALVNFIGSSSATDVASGMRVLRKSSLHRLYPLPDGLDFTPAMSVRALLDTRLRLKEIPMPYEERVGESKLSVVKDGMRFLRIILETSMTYRPRFFFGTAAAVFAAAALWALAASWGGPESPLLYYLRNDRLANWMLFRCVFISWCLSSAAFLAAFGWTAQSLVGAINEEDSPPKTKLLLVLAATSLVLALVISRRMIYSYLLTGSIPENNWIFIVAGSLFALISIEFVAFAVLERVAFLLRERTRQTGA